jgi:hypothetical protein
LVAGSVARGQDADKLAGQGTRTLFATLKSRLSAQLTLKISKAPDFTRKPDDSAFSFCPFYSSAGP